MSESAQKYIAAFQQGEDFVPPAVGVIVNGQVDDAAIKQLEKELAVADPQVREKIVHLLVDMGLRTDALTPKGAEALRNPKILSALAGAGLAKPDLGREAALEALRKLATRHDLARFENNFTNALAEEPTNEAFLLVAKAKAHKAKDLVERLSKLPNWQGSETVKIVRAALGATDLEDEFIARIEEAKNGEELAQAIGPLALIGTDRAIKAIAEKLRTPFTIEISGHMPGRSEKSARLNVLDGLLYNFPDQPELYPNNINSDEDYRAAERFCTETLGVVYKESPPPYMKYRDVPVPLRQ